MITTLRRLLGRPAPSDPEPIERPEPRPDARFRTRGGAHVDVTGSRWECVGCGKSRTVTQYGSVIDEANQHASGCWSTLID